jgi:glycosyltransferase involved in cell wall biosynthesis
MTVWGDGFADLLAPLNPGLELAVTGNHILEGAVHSGSLIEMIGGRPAIGVFLQAQSPLIEARDTTALRRLAASLADRLPEAVVLVRAHPGAPLTAIEVAEFGAHRNVFLAPADEYGLRELIHASTVVCSIYSTTLLEAAALGTVPVILAVTSMDRLLPDLEGMRAAAVVRDWDSATTAVAALLDSHERRAALEPGMREVRERFFAGLRANALERVVAALSPG